MSLLNGLAEAGKSLAQLGGVMAVESMRSSWDVERMRLASEYAEGRESRARAETQAFQRSEREADQEFKRPAQTAAIAASEANTEQSRTATGIAAAKEGRLKAGIEAAGGGAGSGTISEEQRAFVEKIRPWAEAAAQKAGVDPRVIIAQAALETGWGKAAPSNNYFGIKSHGQAGGQVLETTEVGPNGPVKTKDSFRTYNSPQESFDDYAKFISTNSRYGELRGARDLEGQIAALGKSGYATDPQYAAKIGSIARSLGEGGGSGGEMPPDLRRSREALVKAGELDKVAELDARWALEQNKRGMPTQGERERARMGKETPAAMQIFEFYNSLSPEDQVKFRQLNKGDVKLEFREHNGRLIAVNPQTLQAGVVDVPGAETKPPPEAFRKLETEARTVGGALDRFEEVVKKNGGGTFDALLNNPRSPAAQEYNAAFNVLKTALRSEAFINTGVLQPGENKMIDELLLSPQSIRGYLADPASYKAKLDEFRRFLDTKMQSSYASHDLKVPETLRFYREPEAPDAEGNASGFGARGGPSGAAGTPRIDTEEAFKALRSGTIFLAPDGILRRKP